MKTYVLIGLTLLIGSCTPVQKKLSNGNLAGVARTFPETPGGCSHRNSRRRWYVAFKPAIT